MYRLLSQSALLGHVGLETSTLDKTPACHWTGDCSSASLPPAFANVTILPSFVHGGRARPTRQWL
jgi:hypothetical protein